MTDDMITLSNAMLERRIAQARAEAMQWQPIATAPKDGVWIVVWFDFPLSDPKPIVVQWSQPKRGGFPWRGHGGRESDGFAARWMPLPDPPSQDSKEDA